MFKHIDTDEALIVERGVFKPAEVYEGPDGGLYVKAKGGFVRLKSDGSTSHSTVKVKSLAREGPLYRDAWQRLSVSPGTDRKACLLAPPSESDGPLALPAP